jgi:hypothetical protein
VWPECGSRVARCATHRNPIVTIPDTRRTACAERGPCRCDRASCWMPAGLGLGYDPTRTSQRKHVQEPRSTSRPSHSTSREGRRHKARCHPQYHGRFLLARGRPKVVPICVPRYCWRTRTRPSQPRIQGTNLPLLQTQIRGHHDFANSIVPHVMARCVRAPFRPHLPCVTGVCLFVCRFVCTVCRQRLAPQAY